MFVCLITLAKDSSNALNKSSECGWSLSNLMQEEMNLAPLTPKPTVGFMYWHCHFDVCSFYIWSFESCLSHTAWVLSKPPLHLLEGPCCFSPSLRWPVLSHVLLTCIQPSLHLEDDSCLDMACELWWALEFDLLQFYWKMCHLCSYRLWHWFIIGWIFAYLFQWKIASRGRVYKALSISVCRRL